ncbi:hypothetical protein GGTG_13581 [Gaeumannomyces tritici R3-111a-1]|uniref:Uncharacterized protein n=1 Tax=Gaeumannomyces tritici (strain R3-111a-1) TaxID=644352 RepID=J3PJA0_GAET3|nr:hypothetical protein GGTG_13581 [Gaeumannomyces tritici R3-111a-1]EJT68851.1 hypothetical protein GGTG_13581 [Gaeumannomyces tritici R3-111a-1]
MNSRISTFWASQHEATSANEAILAALARCYGAVLPGHNTRPANEANEAALAATALATTALALPARPANEANEATLALFTGDAPAAPGGTKRKRAPAGTIPNKRTPRFTWNTEKTAAVMEWFLVAKNEGLLAVQKKPNLTLAWQRVLDLARAAWGEEAGALDGGQGC